jgi:hypothetical protein
LVPNNDTVVPPEVAPLATAPCDTPLNELTTGASNEKSDLAVPTIAFIVTSTEFLALTLLEGIPELHCTRVVVCQEVVEHCMEPMVMVGVRLID